MRRFMLFGAFFLQHIALGAIDIQHVNNNLVLDKEELSLLNESLKLIMPDQKVLIEVVAALSNDLFETLSKSPFEKWVYYCMTANSLGFSQMIAKMVLSIGHYNTSHNLDALIDSVFWKSLSLFQFDSKELYVFKLIFIKSLQKALRLFIIHRTNNYTNNNSRSHDDIYALVSNLTNLLDENKFLKEKHEELIRPWEKILTYMVSKISENSLENMALSGIKKVVMFYDTEILYKDEKLAYSDIADITIETKERQCLVLITVETGFSGRVKLHKIKFASELEAEFFVEYLHIIRNLHQMSQSQNSDNLNLLSSIYIAGLGYNNYPIKDDIVVADKIAKNFRKKGRRKSKEFQPLKLQQINNGSNRELPSSHSSSSPKKDDSGKHEKRVLGARRNTSDGSGQKGDSARVTFQQVP